MFLEYSNIKNSLPSTVQNRLHKARDKIRDRVYSSDLSIATKNPNQKFTADDLSTVDATLVAITGS